MLSRPAIKISVSDLAFIYLFICKTNIFIVLSFLSSSPVLEEFQIHELS